MSMKQTEQEGSGIVFSTVIETAWMYAHYAHGKVLPGWLHQILTGIRRQTSASQLPVIILPAGRQSESLVVMRLSDFLKWCHRHPTRNDPIGNETCCADRRRMV